MARLAANRRLKFSVCRSGPLAILTVSTSMENTANLTVSRLGLQVPFDGA
jgi:hypothetical protein